MRRLVVAVDCDDVLVPSTEYIVRAYNQRYGTSVLLEQAHSHADADGLWGADKSEVMRRIHEIQLTAEYGSTVPFDEAIQVCRRLARQHELHLVTARASKLMAVTRNMTDRYFPEVFNRIEHLDIDGDKGEACRLVGADVLIDDNKNHLLSAGRQGVGGLIWFGNYPWQLDNTAETESAAVTRCLDWLSVEKEIESRAQE